MKLAEAVCRVAPTRLTVPYRIAGLSFDSVDLIVVTLRDESGMEGCGTASPVAGITGEDAAGTAAALQEAMLPALRGSDVSDLEGSITRAAAAAPRARAALAALDIALHDLHARQRGVPLVTMLGGALRRLYTSITIGIGDPEQMADTARRHAAKGFRAIKVKIGEQADQDLEAVRLIREAVGPSVAIRVDANQGYDGERGAEVARKLVALDVELIEQPVPAADLAGMRQVTEATRIPVVADEAVHVLEDLAPVRLAKAARGVNIKLMKCGGVLAARRLDRALSHAGMMSLVGCMDESCASIAAAAHFSAAAESVRWIDLDGHFDLENDPFEGGVTLRDGELVLSDAPGLGIRAV
jgi:L-alanine-DL-glutamate epimerase-like enolase superfamily enzyme